MVVAWEKLLENSSNFTMVTENQDLEYLPNILLRGLEEVRVIIEP